ncbi:D-alanyl-D-alanine carboxypeptidase/D-alanyl-D-alanine endopeptidase [Actinomyces weissii]|uniref:D-alanyl-D-alanine carboxypeptidase/D-alanyl-D-alanine-endopeptidase n=1 Tax=Actinomyces weissii TaxID=675090 RepID=A0A7T7MAE1_9ACTO|nr:D-alanyl-D-alanine carboxypeptidase/D-alanyl-D-alanine-endopeptidase [Actinomyces weissii]QQM67639.1 D-alanyl-D-alanine carboxypeptidase/D-alanyl-D-alanine-endopeptidase [Actinomyces weissii]
MRKRTVRALSAATLAVAIGYYGVADALDLVPGFVTVAGEQVVAAPFPSVHPPVPVPQQVPRGARADAPLPEPAQVTALASALAANPLVGGGRVGVSVIDVVTGQELADVGARTPLTPASSVKLLTAWAALSVLGPDHTLQTRTTLSQGTVTLVGGGDVLLAEDQGSPTAIAGRAGLGDLARTTAEQLQAQGVASVRVALDDTLFQGPDWNDGWEAGNEDFVARVQPIMVDISARPFGTYPADPAMQAAEVFVEHLKAAGVQVEGAPVRAASPAGAAELAAVTSAPLADVMSVSLKKSDNTMTEVEGRLLAAASGREASFTGATQAVTAQLKAEGFDLTGVSLKDTSGLAKADKVPARLLAQLVQRAAAEQGGKVGRTVVADLPVAALEGTLHDRFHGTGAAGEVRAKTGSLEECASLSGLVVTDGGRLLAYSVIVDGFASGGLWNARSAVDNDFVVPLKAL